MYLKHTPYIIAEMSGNHNGSKARALAIVEQVAKAGANAIKLQTYTADTITLDSDKEDFIISSKSLWQGRRLHDLYNEAHTPWPWYEDIAHYAKKLGLDCFSSVFDESAVDFLAPYNPPFYKISSFEITHLPLIQKCAMQGKPLIISTGLASMVEIAEAYDTAIKYGAPWVALLLCTSQYPAEAGDANLASLAHLQKEFKGAVIGFSDHHLGIGVALGACALGAQIIEKHVTINKEEGGVDADFSITCDELALLVQEAHNIKHAIGNVYYGASDNEKSQYHFRQAIWFKEPIKKGDIIQKHHVKICRPAPIGSIAPKYITGLIGKTAPKDYVFGDYMRMDTYNALT